METICFKDGEAEPVITLVQTAKNKFTVRYGLQVTSNVDYSRAAEELGESIMHKAACEGKIKP